MRADEIVRALGSVGVPCGLVRSVAEAIAGTGASPVTGMPSAVPGTVRMNPPRLDENGEEVRDLGWRAFRQ